MPTAVFSARAASKRGLVDQVGQISTDETAGDRGDFFQVNVVVQLHVLDMDLQDRFAAGDVGSIDQHVSIKTARSQQRGVQRFRSVGRRDHDHARVGIEAVHFDQQGIQRLFAFVMSADDGAAAALAECIQFVDEDDAGARLVACWNMSRTRAAPTPTNISTKSLPDRLKNGTPASPAIALANNVLPVPGGPTNNTPLGIRPPSAWYFSLFLRKSTTSRTSSTASSIPAASSKVIDRFFLAVQFSATSRK